MILVRPVRFIGPLAPLALLALLVLTLISMPARAHPHAWIDVHSTVDVDDTGWATAIEEEWVFDEMYTAAILEGMADGKPVRPDMLAQYASEVIDNLEPYGYFMKLRVDGRLQHFGKPTQYRGVLRGDRFVLSFTAPLAEPVDPVAQKLEFAVYDPTYFIQMMHEESTPPSVHAAGTTTCRAEVHEPKPTAAALARAFAMDWQAEPDDSLGELFAQKVTLTCG